MAAEMEERRRKKDLLKRWIERGRVDGEIARTVRGIERENESYGDKVCVGEG